LNVVPTASATRTAAQSTDFDTATRP